MFHQDFRCDCILTGGLSGGRVIIRESHFFFYFRLYSGVADKGGLGIAASSLPFRVASVPGLLGCLWRNILPDIFEILEGR